MARKDGKDRGLFEYPKESGIWWIYYVDERGNRHREKVGTNKTKARKLYLQRKAEVAEGRHKAPNAPRELLPTLGEAIQEYLATTGQGKRSWRDDRNFATLWTDALGKMTLDQIKPQLVERWKVEWGRHLTPATVNRRLSFLRRIFNVAVRNGDEVKNPVSAIGLYRECNSRERYLTDDEMDRLVAVFPPDWWHVVEFALHTGLRQGEQFGLRWEWIDRQVNVLKIPRSKNGRVRHVPLNERAQQILDDLAVANKGRSPWVFVGRRSRKGRNHLSANWFCRAVFNPALLRAGITDFTYHDLRHTAASYLVMAGVGLRTVQEILGHQTLQMTQRYSHLSPEHQHEAVAKWGVSVNVVMIGARPHASWL